MDDIAQQPALNQDQVFINGLNPFDLIACLKVGAADGCITDANGECTLAFGSLMQFAHRPHVACIAIEPGDTMPVIFKVKAWQQDANGMYTGCTVQAKRIRTLPAVIALLTALLNYDTTVPAPNVEFSRAAIWPAMANKP